LIRLALIIIDIQRKLFPEHAALGIDFVKCDGITVLVGFPESRQASGNRSDYADSGGVAAGLLTAGHEQGDAEDRKERFATHIDSGTSSRSSYWVAGLYTWISEAPRSAKAKKQNSGERTPPE
jgi:hypothetical protein